MQSVTTESLKQRVDNPFLNMVIASAGLTINYDEMTYRAFNGIDSHGKVRVLEEVEPLVRYTATCPQIPDLKIFNSKKDLVEFSTYNYLIKAVRFCVVVDGVEIFGSAMALRDHGFFQAGNEIKVVTGTIDKSAFIRMEPLGVSTGNGNAPFYPFFARSLKDLPDVYAILAARSKVKEISFKPDSFDRLFHEDGFLKS